MRILDRIRRTDRHRTDQRASRPPRRPHAPWSAPNPPITWADDTVVLPGGGSVLDGRPVIIPWSER